MTEGGTKLVLLGVGNAAQAVAEHYKSKSRPCKIYGTTRSADKVSALEKLGIIPLHDDGGTDFLTLLQEACNEAYVLISFPPELYPLAGAGRQSESSELRYAPQLSGAKKIVYISSTGVYGEFSGIVDEQTPCSRQAEAIGRHAAETYWRALGACALRAPALYGPTTGLHKRLLAGTYKIPGNGGNYTSRIHLDDLAVIIDAAFELANPGSMYVVGDLQPSTHIETVTWLCQKLDLPIPASLPLDHSTIHSTMRANRQVDASLMRRELLVSLKYPTYKEGFTQCLFQAGRGFI